MAQVTEAVVISGPVARKVNEIRANMASKEQ